MIKHIEFGLDKTVMEEIYREEVRAHLQSEEMKEVFREEMRAHLQKVEEMKTYWTIKDLQRETGFSIPYIREHILFEPGLGAWRDGNQWRMVSHTAKQFLTQRGLYKHKEQTRQQRAIS